MRGLTRRWILPAPPGTAPVLGHALPPLVRRLLAARGFRDQAAIDRFLTPRLTELADPKQLPGADAAAKRLVEAARRGEAIAIYGDYDVDGITATAILYRIIRAAAPSCPLRTYVPHRLDEGYGLSAAALEQLAEDGTRLVVSVDCGITAVGPAASARAAGLELIITDHHKPPATLPDALIVHPDLEGSSYPCRELCGAGVAFMLGWCFLRRWCSAPRVDSALQKLLLDLLPLVALGTIADVVPLAGENRVFAAMGLRLIKGSPLTGIRALIEAAKLSDENIDSEKVGFVLAPRLNACGRMGHAADAIQLLITDDPDEAMTIARRLTKLNEERRAIERTIVEEATQMAVAGGMTDDDQRVIVLAHAGWHPGVLGIVCSRLVDRFSRPTVLMQVKDGICKGSARSIDGYSIHDALQANASYLDTFGGHDAAAGLTLAHDQLEPFVQAMTKHANSTIEVDQLTPALRIDCVATLSELDQPTVQWIQRLSPFGRANRRPLLQLAGVHVAEPPRVLGAEGRHLMVRVRQDVDGRRHALRTMWWGGGEHLDAIHAGAAVDVVIEPKLNTYKGQTNVEGVVRDIRLATSGSPLSSVKASAVS